MTTRSERGFTLVELVVSIVIAGIIFPALTGVVIIGLRTLDNTNEKLSGSNDSLLIGSYFTSDVEGASYLATDGTRAHLTPAVTLPSGVNTTALLTFFAVKGGAASVTSPPSGGTAWDTTNPPSLHICGSQSGSLTSSLADEVLLINDDNRNDTLARVGTTVNPTSSITHGVALRPSGSGNIVRRTPSCDSEANSASLVLSKPSGVAQNDVLIAHVTAATSANKVIAPSGWTLVDSLDLSPTFTSLVYVRAAGLTEPSSWAWGFQEGSGTHDAAGGIVGYTNISTGSPVAAHRVAANPCGGEHPVLSIATADRLEASSTAYFFETVGAEHELVRRACTSTGLRSVQVLARQLQATSAATVTCNPVACDPLPASATLTLREPAPRHESRGRSYVLSARTRTG